MLSPQKVLVPGIICGSAILVLIAHLLTSTQIVVAATPEASVPQPAALSEVANDCSFSIPDSISRWCGLILEAAQTYHIPAELIAAVMLQESGGQPEVISASGAVGLLQVMPNDGIASSFQCANGPCFASRPSTQELMDPAFNIDYGVRMLAGLIQNYGSERDGLKAYGPYNVGYYYADKVLAIRDNL
ncbi:MAG: lytic transglycosylase domain-containing protein [Anaerolineaceae bacterium]